MDSLPSLTIVPAGAGSGKTYYLQHELAKRIKNKSLTPESIVAVTFTEAAAAELRGRIRAALVSDNMLEQAMKLDQAYISTIHGFGLRLISEFAFDGALSPSPRLLNEDEQGMLISKTMAHSASATMMMGNLDRFGYRYDFFSETTPEESFRKGMLSFIATLRGIGKSGAVNEMLSSSEKKIRDLYGPTRIADHLKEALLSAISSLLQAFPSNLAPDYNSIKSASDQLRNDFNRMRRATNGKALDSDWKLWQSLRSLRLSNQRTKLPSGYDDLAEQVMSAANVLPHHPGPLQDALNHAAALLQATSECLTRYSDEKQQRGLVDFTDMLSQAHNLLCNNQQVADAFRQRIGCLVVDEFQDTNPLQFSLLWSLTRQSVPTIIVGDLKQAIMGFQGADPRLMQELITRYPDASKPQTGNYRSSKPLMHWINLVGASLFGDAYTALTAEAQYTSKLSPLEVIEARDKLKESVWASHTSARLVDLINSDAEIYDRHRKVYRPLRGGDIAIIGPTNKRLQAYAAALRSYGIRCKLDQDGWYESRIVQLSCYALQYIADPADRYAALYLSVTELGSHTLQSALDELVAGRELHDPILDKLVAVFARRTDRFLDELLEGVIAELDLYGTIAFWPDGNQARANLLRLQQECREFRTANCEALASGGYYGAEIKTFLAWLKGRVGRDDRQPGASVIDEDAVQLATWHSSKGREWPVVAVCGLERDVTPRLPATRVADWDFSDLSKLLDSACVEIYPNFVAPDTCEEFSNALVAEARDGAARLLYVALTRAREKLILEWPGSIAAKDTASGNTYWDLLIGKAKLELSGNAMFVDGTSVDCRITVVDKEPQEAQAGDEKITLQPYGRRSIILRELTQSLTLDHRTPSSLHGVQAPQIIWNIEKAYLASTKVLQGMSAAGRGTMLHRCFELLLARPELAHELPALLGEPLTAEEAPLIAGSVKAFKDYLTERLNPLLLRSEAPFIRLDNYGTVITGTIDLLVETADGFWIIDHKSDQIDKEGLQSQSAYHFPQLKAYADAVAALHPDIPVRGIAINWISLGMMTTLESATNAL
jgi:ATP-dependent exoDNAse (exonuclease V) beta subunit